MKIIYAQSNKANYVVDGHPTIFCKKKICFTEKIFIIRNILDINLTKKHRKEYYFNL